MDFPKYVYHRELPPRVVADPDELAALGDGWAETPAAFEDEAAAAEKPKLKKKG